MTEKNNDIYIVGDIEENTVSKVISEAQEIEKKNIANDKQLKNYKWKSINLHIDSYGGGVYEGLAIYNFLSKLRTPVYTYCHGKCMSMAFILFLVGEKRFTHNSSTFMYHQIRGFAGGTNTDIAHEVKIRSELQNKLDAIITEKTFIKSDKLKKFNSKNKDWYIGGDKALKLNIATNLIGEMKND